MCEKNEAEVYYLGSSQKAKYELFWASSYNYRTQNSSRNVSELNKKTALNFYTSHRIMLSLPFKKYVKNVYLQSTLGIAYEEYAMEQHALGNRVLLQSAVYRCIKRKVRMRM